MARLYLDTALLEREVAVGGDFVLSGSEGRHAATVSRVRPGEEISISNGAGVIARGEAVSVVRDRVAVRVTELVEVPAASPRILLAQALAKGGRDELAVQAATELGVDGVVPWAAARSIPRWEGAKLDRGRARWAGLVREASKQACRAWVPTVAALESTAALASRAPGFRVLVLDPQAGTPLTALNPDERDILLVVGPEGGLTSAERETLLAAGAEQLRLGATVLRTSTAGPAAIAVLSAALGRW